MENNLEGILHMFLWIYTHVIYVHDSKYALVLLYRL